MKERGRGLSLPFLSFFFLAFLNGQCSQGSPTPKAYGRALTSITSFSLPCRLPVPKADRSGGGRVFFYFRGISFFRLAFEGVCIKRVVGRGHASARFSVIFASSGLSPLFRRRDVQPNLPVFFLLEIALAVFF